jgi:hypothetical protein
VILDNDDSHEASAGDNEAEGASGDVNAGRFEQDASLQNTFATSELASAPTKSTDVSSLWYDPEEGCYEELAPGLGSSEPHGVPSAPVQAQPQTLAQSFKPLQDQTNQQGIDDITQSTSVESMLHPLPKSSHSGDDGWTDNSMAELEKELGLALEEPQVESLSVGTPTSPSPHSVEAPQDETQNPERSETTGSRPEELQDACRCGTPAQGLEWKQRETLVAVETLGGRELGEEALVGEAGGVEIWQHEEPLAQKEVLGPPVLVDQQNPVEVDDTDDPMDKEATEALPATQPKIPDKHHFRLRGIRTQPLPGRQTGTTQYRIVWGEHPNRSDSWFNEDDVQISMPCEPYSQDLAL